MDKIYLIRLGSKTNTIHIKFFLVQNNLNSKLDIFFALPCKINTNILFSVKNPHQSLISVQLLFNS